DHGLRGGNAVGQLGFYDLVKRLEAISTKDDPLEALDGLVAFASFCAGIEAVVKACARGEEKQSRPQAMRQRHDVQDLGAPDAPNVADEQVEYQIRDRLSLTRFLGLGLKDALPDATTVRLFQDALAEPGLDQDAVRAPQIVTAEHLNDKRGP